MEFDVLTKVVDAQEVMQKDILYIRDKIDFLYRIDPPGPLMLLSTHLGEAKAAKWRERTFFAMLAGSAGTIASYIFKLFGI